MGPCAGLVLMHCQRAVECLLAAAAAGLLGCESHPGELPLSETVSPIVGGSLASPCAWPTTIMLQPIGCSGTLVHPRVVVTAKHCLVNDSGNPTPPSSIGLGETRSAWARTVDVSRCYTHPSDDLGVCVLAEDVTGLPIVPVMAPCEMSELAAGKPIVEVGFGVTSERTVIYGTKKWINGTINNFDPAQADIDVTTGSQDGEYYGDSGGPLFFRMPDSTWRLIGADCCSDAIIPDGSAPRVSIYESVPYDLAWAEQVSGVDLTPCHDANGWNPTAACTGFPTNPGDGVGTWATLCQGESMVPQPTCQGTPFGSDGGGAEADAGVRDAPKDGPVDGNLGDSQANDGEADLHDDSNEGWAAGDEDAAEIGDSAGMGGATGSGKGDAGGPDQGLASFADSGASGDAGGSSADGDGNPSDGSGGAGGTANSASDGGNLATAGEGRSSNSDGAGDGGTDGKDAAASVSDSGGSGSDLATASEGDRPIFDSSVDQKAGRTSGSGCSCRSVSDREASAWPSFALLGLALVVSRLIRWRSGMGTLKGFPYPPAMVRGERSSPAPHATRSRGRFVV